MILTGAIVAEQISLFQYFEPFGTLFFLDGTVSMFSILIGFIIACFMVPRFYCRYACPLGAALGVLSLVSLWRIRRVPSANSVLCASRPVRPAQSAGKALTSKSAFAATSATRN